MFIFNYYKHINLSSIQTLLPNQLFSIPSTNPKQLINNLFKHKANKPSSQKNSISQLTLPTKKVRYPHFPPPPPLPLPSPLPTKKVRYPHYSPLSPPLPPPPTFPLSPLLFFFYPPLPLKLLLLTPFFFSTP